MSDSLDIEDSEALLSYLRSAGRIAPGETPRITNLAGGVSNRTVLLERASGEAWVLKQALERLRVRVDWFSDPRRVEREALGMQTLAEFAPAGAITPLVFVDPAHHLLAMKAVPQPHENWKTMLLAGRLERDHVRQFAVILASIHRGGFEGRERFTREFGDRSFFESLRLEPYYEYSAQQRPAAAPFISALVKETRDTLQTLVHGDYSPKNVLVHNGSLILLDHEVIHFGDAAFDLGFAMTHLLAKALHLRARRADFGAAASTFWFEHQKQLGLAPWAGDLEARAVRHTLACMLARCVGRSPLEYLDARAAGLLENAAISLMGDVPATVAELVQTFVARIGGADARD